MNSKFKVAALEVPYIFDDSGLCEKLITFYIDGRYYLNYVR